MRSALAAAEQTLLIATLAIGSLVVADGQTRRIRRRPASQVGSSRGCTGADAPSPRERGGGDGLPRFVERELREFLTCGVMARGFACFRCDGCAREILVAFSCKGHICPSCCGRRMGERAAHLVDGVLGGLPIRQWVLTLPFRLRYRLAYDHRLCRAVLGVFVRALLGFAQRRARALGIGRRAGVPPSMRSSLRSPAQRV